MADILTPTLGESVSEATVARWTKKPGDRVKKDEVLVELETDKVGLEVAAPADGVLGEITAAEGANVTPGAKLGSVTEAGAQKGATAGGGKPAQAAAAAPAQTTAEGGERPILDPIPAGDGAGPAGAPADSGQTGASQANMPEAATDYPGEAQGGSLELKAPSMGESVPEGTVARWTKKVGDAVKKDEVLVEIETDKVAVEVASPADGVLAEISADEGAAVTPGQTMGRVAAGTGAGAPAPAGAGAAPAKPQSAAAQPAQAAGGKLSPAVRRIVDDGRLDPSTISGSGKDGRITKGDALQAMESRQAQPAQAAAPAQQPQAAAPSAPRETGPREERVRMTRLRQTIARRLKEAQNTAAMLTTFNEVDMTGVMEMRSRYKDAFEKRHGVKLGFMSFFVKATVAALKEIPAVNAEIDGTDIIYKNHFDIGVAVGTDRGLVVPVVRDAEQLSLAEIEKTIGELGRKARDNELSIEDMQGGTFTVSNGGVYGSLMSTPILNPPQSGVLGMHKIQERPMVVDGQIVVRPMMYLALSYDHRIVDGKEAVTFLVRIKEHVEQPERLLLEV